MASHGNVLFMLSRRVCDHYRCAGNARVRLCWQPPPAQGSAGGGAVVATAFVSLNADYDNRSAAVHGLSWSRWRDDFVTLSVSFDALSPCSVSPDYWVRVWARRLDRYQSCYSQRRRAHPQRIVGCIVSLCAPTRSSLRASRSAYC